MNKYNRRKFTKNLLQGAAITFLMPSVFSRGATSCINDEKKIPAPEMDTNELIKLMSEFTEVYKQYSLKDIYSREAACMEVQWPALIESIIPGDLFAGRSTQPPIGCRPQSDELFLGYYIHPSAIKKLYNAADITEESKTKLDELVAFWNKENTVSKAKKAFTREMNEALSSERQDSGIASILWRVAGVQFNYGKLMRQGISGLKEELEGYRKSANIASNEYLFYTAALTSLDTFTEVACYYADQAVALANKSHSNEEKKELKEIAKVLQQIATKPPTSFREGLQLMYLYNALAGTRDYGRMDDYLGDLYVADINNGVIDEEEAIRLLTGLWHLMAARNYKMDNRIIIGGKGRRNEKNANQLALVIMETTKRVADIVPQLALRFYEGQDPRLYQKALDVLATGNTFPMLYNDEVIVPSVQAAFNVPYDEAIHAIQFGCGEYVLDHRSVGTPSGLINILQALIVTLNKGIDPKTGNPIGMPVERYDKYNNFETFDALMAAYKEQIEYHVVQLAKHEELEYLYAGKDNPYLFLSILMDDCLPKGKGLCEGGVRYLGGTVESYGNSNTADSFTAIKELVYDKKQLTIDQVRKMINANFEGFSKERKMLLECPKYGNDNEVADQMLVDIHNHLCNFTRAQSKNTSLHSYLVVVINNHANTLLGMKTQASPDGRLAYTYMNPGNNPVGGADKNGLTAFLNSLLKPSTYIHAGAVQNMKFSKELFTEHRPMLEALLATYFKNGGAQAMLTVISRGDLEEAMKHPENYQNLIVRVGGFSQRFVSLPKEVQLEILSRTLY